MSKLLAALSWQGRDTMLSLFVAFPHGHSAHLAVPDKASQPGAVRTYDLEDSDGRLPTLSFVEYDLAYCDAPSDLELVVRGWLRAAMTAGASLAWFAFEGSFDLDHVLTRDIANQIYGFATPSEMGLALLDELRESPDWAALLDRARKNVGLLGLK